MKLIRPAFALLVLLSLAAWISGCAEMTGAVAGGIYGGLTGASEEEALAFADAVTQSIKENEAQQAQIELQKQQEAALLAKLPAEWKCAGSELYQDDSGSYIYAHPDQQTWYKWTGNAWVNPDANTQAASAAPVPRQKPILASTPASSGEEKTATLADARKAKKDQRLQGRMFQDSSTKTWFLENQEGTTYKLKNGAFVKL